MRAKNEFKFIAEAYNTKLILERIVDGTLMCPEACCGAPVMECKCGPDCEHCNCHEIQKLAKEEDNEGAAGHLRRAAARGAVRHDDDSDAALWKKQMKHQPKVSPERWKELQNKKPKPQSYSKKHPKSEDNEVHLQGTGWAGKPPPVDEEDEPRRGISGAIHKPYVSSFVSDGGKIFGVMGSDGKIVHKTRDKQKAYKWFRDNYENI